MIIDELMALGDEEYRNFTSALVPTVDKNRVIGVRAPALRSLAKRLCLRNTWDVEEFKCALPHTYLEENNLHAYLINEIKDFRLCIRELERFLPYVDNWATCDAIRPKCLKKHKRELLPHIDCWLLSEHTYTVRFGIEVLMQYYLDEDFDKSHIDKILAVKQDDYYVKMMIAWYFATALSERWEDVIVFLEEEKLPLWIHNKTIQKAVESYRIPTDRKDHLRSLRRKK